MDEDEVTAIIRPLAHYLRANPTACDSAQGIAQWWLPTGDVSTAALMAALDWLEAQGVLEETTGSDGRTRYRRRGDDDALVAALAARTRAPRPPR